MVTCVEAVSLGGEEVVACPSPGTAKYQAWNLPYPGGLRIDGWGGLAWGQLLVWLLTPRNISGPQFLCLSRPHPNSGWPTDLFTSVRTRSLYQFLPGSVSVLGVDELADLGDAKGGT